MADAKPATTPRSSYRGVEISYEQFCDLMILAMTQPSADGTDSAPWDLNRIVDRIGFKYRADWINDFASDMENFVRDVIMQDTAEGKDLSAYPNGAAFELKPHLVSKYFNSEEDVINIFNPDYTTDPFDGIGQVDVSFFGETMTIGCIEGEEEKTRDIVKQIESAAGETTKAIAGPIDRFRALLMGSVQIANALEEATRTIPASDRIVPLDHNSPDYKNALNSLDETIQEFDADHNLDNALGREKSALIGALRAGRELLQDTEVNLRLGIALLVEPLRRIIAKYDQAIVGGLVSAAATAALVAILKLLGIA